MRKPIAPSESWNGDGRSVPGMLPEVHRRRRWPENPKVVGNWVRRHSHAALGSRSPTVHVAPPGARRNTADLGPEIPTPTKLVHQSTGGVNGGGGWFLGFSRVGSSIPPSIWAEEVGKREKWGRRLERERGRTGSVSFPANGGGFRGNKWRSKAGREEGSILGVRSGLGVVGNAWTGGGGAGEEEGEGGVGRERLRAKVNLPLLQNYLKAPP